MEDSSVHGFECQVGEDFRSACSGTADYEYEDKRYCILHFPSEDKEEDFEKAVQSKLEWNDLEFAGVYFPSGFQDFSRVTFSEQANFYGATFSEGVTFYGTTFSERANFIEATFSEVANFSRATFIKWAYFSEATFSERANFSGATFSKEANFSEATFGEKADFPSATFRDDACFSGATFRGRAYFVGATFSKRVYFLRATFEERAIFWKLVRRARTELVFRDTTIEKPERISFHTARLRPSWFVDVDAQKFDFTNVEWFRRPNDRKRKLENEILVLGRRGMDPRESLRKLSTACRRLMNNAEDDHDYPTANEFHYWSMEAVRKESWESKKVAWQNLRSRLNRAAWRNFKSRLSRIRRRKGSVATLNWTWRTLRGGLSFGFGERSILTLYWALSGYGDRPRRAFWILVVIWLGFALLYSVLGPSSPSAASSSWEVIRDIAQATVYSSSALVRLNPRPPTPDEIDLFRALVIVEGIIGPLQIALFLLAVRRKVMR